jgi:hypothetical protein
VSDPAREARHRIERLGKCAMAGSTISKAAAWILGELRALVETQALEQLEQRPEELAPSIEGKTHGHPASVRRY